MATKSINIEKVWFEADRIFILTSTGEERSHPLGWFPKLLNANTKERNQFELSPFGIHWPSLDEDLSFEGFFHYQPSVIKSN